MAKLDYKAKARGIHLIKINPWYASSKTCHRCDHKQDELPLSVRRWTCPDCQAEHDRDLNAALNIKRQGIVVLKAAGLVVSADGGPRQTGVWPAAA